MNLAILTNGPGEAWGWARPLIGEAQARGWQVDVWLLPCPFSSGREQEALARLGAAIECHGSALATWRAMGQHETYDAVLQLGGDLLFGRRLAKVSGALLACYGYGDKKGMKWCDLVMAPRQGLLSRFDAVIVGDLVLDSLRPGPCHWTKPAGSRLLVLPGSRPTIREQALPMVTGLRQELERRFADLEVRVPLSPFVRAEERRRWIDAGFQVIDGTAADGAVGADLALTQPGTNTLELMYLKVPTLLVLPFSFTDSVPISGLLDVLVPRRLLSGVLKRRAYRWKGRMAWPNRLAGREIVPELVGDVGAHDLALAVEALLGAPEKLVGQRIELGALADQVCPGTPTRMCDLIEGRLRP